jgi:hypothetical protein
MLKLTIATMAATAALLVPTLAQAGTVATSVKGTVVAKQAKRHVLVLATARRDAMSVRISSRQLHETRLGARVSAVGRRLADGSLHATHLRLLGHARRARLSAVILKAKAQRLLLAAGGSAFSIRLSHGTRLLASAASVHSGQKVDAEVEFSHGRAVGRDVQENGDAAVAEFSGVVTAIDATSFTIANDGISTVVQLPDGAVLPPVVDLGSEVEVVASISGSTLTLVTIKLDDESSQDNGGSNVDGDGQVEAEGFVTALDSSSITIQPGDNASPVTFAIPTGFALPSGLIVGSVVEARGDMVNDALTLTRLELKTEDGDQAELEAEGSVTALDSGSITIQTSDGEGNTGTPVSFAIPDGFALPTGLAIGSPVDAKGTMAGGIATLTEIEIQNDSGD